MKAAVILCFIFAYLQAEVLARAVDKPTPLDPEEEQCIIELQLNKNEIQTLNSLDIAPEDNSAFNLFLGCYYGKMGWVDSNGAMNYDNYRSALEGAIVEELDNESPAVKLLVQQMLTSTVTECEKNPPPKGKTPGETVVKVQNCVVEKLNYILNDSE